MTPPRLWAPRAARVDVLVGGRRLPMRREGAWFALGEPLAAGADYAFSLDGGAPLPDPRSPFQPAGVHGPSRAVDHAAFRWSDAGFQARPLAAALIYELHVGTFSPEGTFDGARARLDHLVDLGVTHVELMPVAEFPGARGWGYDGVDLFAPHHAYGGPDGLRRLVDACHARGLAVLIDVVYNHLGPAGNYLDRFGPYFTDRYRTPWGPAINLDDEGADQVRAFLVDNARAWLRDYHADGLRLDAVHALHDRSARHFVAELTAAVAALGAHLGRHLVVIAESDLNDPRVVRPRECGGLGADAQWSDDFHHALHVALTGERGGYYADFAGLADVAVALTDAFVYRGRRSAARGRRHGASAAGLPGHHFLGYLQNHDQIGNRARGERLGHLVPAARQQAGAALVFCAPFVPLLFMGEEWAASAPFPYFTDHDDPALAAAVRDGRRREFAAFGWRPDEVPDPQAPATFAAARLDWSEPARAPHAGVWAWYRALARLRRAAPELTDGDLDAAAVRCDAAAGWLCLRRGAIAVACNLSDAPRAVPLPFAPARLLLASHPAGTRAAGEAVELPPDAVAIVADG